MKRKADDKKAETDGQTETETEINKQKTNRRTDNKINKQKTNRKKDEKTDVGKQSPPHTTFPPSRLPLLLEPLPAEGSFGNLAKASYDLTSGARRRTRGSDDGEGGEGEGGRWRR